VVRSQTSAASMAQGSNTAPISATLSGRVACRPPVLSHEHRHACPAFGPKIQGHRAGPQMDRGAWPFVSQGGPRACRRLCTTSMSPNLHPFAPIFTEVSDGSGTVETAAGMVKRVVPTDDVGSRTADLFDWQAAMAAADGLSLYHRSLNADGHIPDTDDGEIICEHHEDWVVVSGPDAELVSAKHRELSSGPFRTTTQLVEAGGLGHLFNRWSVLDNKLRCRLVTSTAPASGEASQLAQSTDLLRRRAAGGHLQADQTAMIDRVIEVFVRALLSSRDCPSAWREGAHGSEQSRQPTPSHRLESEAFLQSLTIDHSRPQRQWIQHVSPSAYARPVLERMYGSDRSYVEAAVWEAVHNLFRARMRNAGPSPTGGLPTVLGSSGENTGSGSNGLETRTVTNADIYVAIQTARKNPLGYRPLRAPLKLTKLSVKMARGECADTSIGRAEELRMAYSRYWRERRNNVPGSSSEQRELERALMRLADHATNDCRLPTESWGVPLWIALDHRTESMNKSILPTNFDSSLALGGISDLAAQCKVWFSDAFDVKAALSEIKRERGL
jgi:hypothetical protein